MNQRLALRFLGLTVLALSACTGTSDDDDGPCLVGRVIDCPCFDGSSGIRICEADGSFSLCVCGDDVGFPDAGGDVSDDSDARDTTDAANADIGLDAAETGIDVQTDVTQSECQPECDETEYCNAGVCTQRQVCSETDASCDRDTYLSPGGGFVCVEIDLSEATTDTRCRPLCETVDDCASGEACLPLHAEGEPSNSACFASQCEVGQDVQCDNAGPNGGTCYPIGGIGICSEAGTGAPYEACTANEDCRNGLGCSGTCQPYCELGRRCENGLPCLDVLGNPDFGLCAACSGFGAGPDECPADFGCVPFAPGDGGGGLCRLVGSSNSGELCADGDETETCVAGLGCVDIAGSRPSECRPYCDGTAADPNAPCPGGYVCSSRNGVGLCVPGCMLDGDTNACEALPGAETCLPLDGDDGGCIESGMWVAGQACNLIDGNRYADCRGAVCEPNDPDSEDPGAPGICQPLCRTFSTTGEFDSGCAAGEVCDLRGLAWGVCNENVSDPPIEALQPCPTAGQWCDEGIMCFEVDSSGNSLCIPYCRPGDPEGDDCAPYGGTGCQIGFFVNDVLGLCLPN